MIQFALDEYDKQHISGFGRFFQQTHKAVFVGQRAQLNLGIINNADANFVYSHFGDLADNPPQLQAGFQWVRPYYQVGKPYLPCQHNLTARLLESNKTLLNAVKKYPDGVCFIEGNGQERYPNLIIKDPSNETEYYCNLYNSPIFVCQGTTSFLADAFYNGKYSLIFPNYTDAESLINSHISQKWGTGKMITYLDDIGKIKLPPLPTQKLRSDIKFLHQHINNLCLA